jgi:hypothetical protein
VDNTPYGHVQANLPSVELWHFPRPSNPTPVDRAERAEREPGAPAVPRAVRGSDRGGYPEEQVGREGVQPGGSAGSGVASAVSIVHPG